MLLTLGCIDFIFSIESEDQNEIIFIKIIAIIDPKSKRIGMKPSN